MRIAVGSDHRGVQVRQKVVELLRKLNHEVDDVGTDSTDSVDYPDIAAAVARAVVSGEVDRGVLTCGTGIGVSIAANKINGIQVHQPTEPNIVGCTLKALLWCDFRRKIPAREHRTENGRGPSRGGRRSPPGAGRRRGT